MDPMDQIDLLGRLGLDDDVEFVSLKEQRENEWAEKGVDTEELLEPHQTKIEAEAQKISNEISDLNKIERDSVRNKLRFELETKFINALVENDENPNGTGAMEDPNTLGTGGENQRSIETEDATSEWGLMDYVVIGGGLLIVLVLILVLLT